LKTDHWFYGLFQSAPDLITLLLPGAAAASLGPDAPGDALYRFEAPELKAVNHRLDGVLWPRVSESGTPEQPVVLLEVQMFSDPGFQHRLAAQSFRFLQQHPHVEHVALVVVTPHNRQRLGPARPPLPLAQFWQQVHALSLEELSQQEDLDPMLALLTLPVRPEAELQASTQQILERRPDLLSAVLPIVVERLKDQTEAQIMKLLGIPAKDLLHTRAVRDWFEQGRQVGEVRGRAIGEAAVAIRLLNRRCGPLSEATSDCIKALPLERLEALTDALLDFNGPADLTRWLAKHSD
jgi:predicted transposase YdaD